MQDKMDVFREIASIASAHASNALSEILKRKVKIELPRVTFLSSQEIFKDTPEVKQVVGVEIKLLAGLQGKVLLVLEEKTTYKLIDRLYKNKENLSTGSFAEVGLSLVKEVGNIVIGSYVGALGIFLNILILPSLPTLVSGIYCDVMKFMVTSQEFILLIEALLKEEGSEIKGEIYFALTKEGKEKIEKSCEEVLKSLKEGKD